MPKLKSLSGEDVIRIFSQFGFEIASQKGSHAKLRRVLSEGAKQSFTVPLHKELDKGTLKAMFRQALRYVSEEESKPYFYGDRMIAGKGGGGIAHHIHTGLSVGAMFE